MLTRCTAGRRHVVPIALASLLITTVVPPVHAAAIQIPRAPAPSLRIVVLEGEDAVNIIQQRTAVAPVVEVRDRNDQPVAGAVVSFVIRNGRATFGGARTLTVTTNATGRAVAAGLTPTGTGPLQIAASAAYQGQTAAITIAQTNVATAAQAAAAGAGGASGGGAGAAGTGAASGGSGAAAGAGAATGAGAGAAAGGAAASGAAAAGGGIGLTTIGVVGAAVAGGAYAATKVAGNNSDQTRTLTGTYSAPVAQNYVFTPQGTCTRSWTVQGKLSLEFVEGTGTVAGDLDDEATWTVSSTTCGGEQVGATIAPGATIRLGGTPSAMSGTYSRTGSPAAGIVETATWTFSGSESGDTAAGTLTVTSHLDGPNFVANAGYAVSVTLR
jgi:hypothetical protein